jgi:small-conductance mechanosensitive channel
MPEEQDKAATEAVANADLEKKETVEDHKEQLSEAKDELKEAKKELESEDLSQAERSRLGRRVKRLEDSITETNQLLRKMMEGTPHTKAVVNEEPEYISTQDDVVKVLRKVYGATPDEIEEAQSKYQKDYLEYIDKIREDDEQLHEEIMDTMMKDFNIRRGKVNNPNTWNPYTDAELNYEKAKASLFKKKYVKPKINLKGEKTGSNANVSVTSTSDATKAATFKLDDDAMSLIKHYGMKEENIKETLDGKFPAHLRGR